MRVLLIDDCRGVDFIESQYGIRPTDVARTYADAITQLQNGPWDLVYLDHDLAEPDPNHTGYGIMNFLEANASLLPKDIHFVTSNPVGRQQMLVVYKRLYS